MIDPLLVGAVALAVILASAWATAVAGERRRKSLEQRVAQVAAAPLDAEETDDGVSLRRAAAGSRPLLRMVPGIVTKWVTAELAATGDRLTAAHLALTSVAVFVLAALSLRFFRLPLTVAVVLALGMAIGAAVFLLRQAQRRFQSRFERSFADALDIIVRAVRAGLPVLDAMQSAVAEAREPVAGEFRRVLDELRIGLDLEDVLEQAAARIRVTDFRFFAVSLVLQRRTGGGLAETLSNLSRLIRQRAEVRIKAGALTAEARASAVVLGVIPFLVTGIMYLMAPQTIGLLFTDPRGNKILGVAVLSLCMGLLIMRTMIKRALR